MLGYFTCSIGFYMKKNTPRVAVIGAGCSGLTAIKNLIQAGVKHIVCYEKGNQVGGNWVYTGQVAHSSVCETTHLISSKTMSEFEDFPMPAHYPDYPSHAQVLAYFQSYASHFDLEPYIRFNTEVLRIKQNANASWEIETADGQIDEYDFLLIANGHHSKPRHPDFKADFTGDYLHSHAYKNNTAFKDKKVLVVGAGNSACDCATEISRVASFVGLSIRTPQYIIPKFFMGRPVDVAGKDIYKAPKFLRPLIQKITLALQIGSYENYGLEVPKHPLLAAHPTINSEVLYKIKHGKIAPRRGIQKIVGQEVFFADGTSEHYDVLLAATGYQIAMPFFDPDFLDYSDADEVLLYQRMFHPVHPSLIFIGLIQPQGAVWPISDRQAKLAANWIMGRYQLPSNLMELAQRESEEIKQRFLKRKRHSIEVDFHECMKRLQQEIPRGAPGWV